MERGNPGRPGFAVPEVKNITFLERAVLYRREKGWTQAELAERLGCSRVWVSNMEAGRADPALLRAFWT